MVRFSMQQRLQQSMAMSFSSAARRNSAVPEVPPITCLPSDAFATLTPISCDSVSAYRAPGNKRLPVSWVKAKNSHSNRQGILCESVCLFPLTFSGLYGQRTISFGASRASTVQLPARSSDVEDEHFIIRYELQTALLMIIDTSTNGTWISEDDGAGMLLRRSAWPLTKPLFIEVGHGRRLRFRLDLVNGAGPAIPDLQYFGRYVRSLDQATPAFLQRLEILTFGLGADGREFMTIHNIAPGRFEKIRTCFRRADGHLFAVKVLSHLKDHEEIEANHTSSGRAMAHREAEFLRTLNHPNIVRFIAVMNDAACTFIYMDFAPIGSFANLLTLSLPRDLPDCALRPLLNQSLSALGYLHDQSISHNNIRPESILVQSLQPFQICLCNFERAAVEGIGEGSTEQDILDVGIMTLVALACLPWQGLSINSVTVDLPLSQQLSGAIDMIAHRPYNALLEGLVRFDPALRLKAGEALRHDWLHLPPTVGKRRRSVVAAVEYAEGGRNKRPCKASDIQQAACARNQAPRRSVLCNII